MPYLTPDAPGSFSGRVLIIPDSYVASVSGALEELANDWNWEAFGEDSVDDAVARMQAMIEDYQMSDLESVIQPYGILSPGMVESTSDAMAFTVGTGQITNGFWSWASPAVLHKIEWLVTAPPEYLIDVRVIGIKRNNVGKMRLYIDNGSVGDEFDWYNSTTQNNIIVDFLNATLDTFQQHVLTLQVTGKNASSSAYNLNISQVLFRVHQ